MKNHKEQFPKIRFHTYCDEWRQHKLGEVFEQTVEYVDPYEQNLELWSVTVESGLTPKEERYNREFLVKKSDKFKKLYPEEIVYNPMNITIGAVGFNNVGKEVAVSGYYVTMKIKSKFSNKFFSVWLSCPKAISLYKIYSTGSLIERQRVQFPTLSEIRASFPSFTEQSSIGSLFRTLDDLLTSYKDNLTKYQSLKATMLSKMFPKAGQTVPEIRLDGFEGEWDEWKLSDISQKVTEKNKDNIYSETFTNSAEFGIINQRDFFDKDISNEKSLNTYYVVRNNDYVYNPRISNFAPVGPIKRNKLGRTGVMSPLYFVFRVTNSNFDLDFLETFFNTNTWHKFMKLNGDSGARADRFAIKDSVFLNMPITIPSLLEQQAIGSYFSNLDQLITSYQEKISQLETLKKKLLQDMFI
ncbi:restriction endonuclease subunit S [Streptococcus salivarius]